ncbi:MAG TPA: ADP-ribosylglycohydrolase family protein [Vicinamibacterales bacterium]|nr:ADP-ribosylglycohydrolase family protein [Vicinamibacterales bacterium]
MSARRLALAAVLAVTVVDLPAGNDATTRVLPVDVYRDKVYASWLGQVIGNIYGIPHENKYIDEPGPETFPYGYTTGLQRMRQVNGAYSDDDTDVEYMYLLAMERFGPQPTYTDLASLWKHHVRGSIWLANRAALAAIHHGFTPPVTGRRGVNPHWFQIDPQLINEIWAVTAPGMVEYAARKSEWGARIMTDGWAVEPTMFYGAMYAAAFFESDVNRLIDIGVANLPEGSRFAKTVADMRELHRRFPGDWKAARAEMARRYYHDEDPDTKTIWNANLNGAAAVLAMLYGKGDFRRTLDLACAMGFDADNQAATVSGLLGVVLGTERLPKDLLFPLPELGWTGPFNDFYRNVTRHDMPDASLVDMAARMAAQGEKIILAHGGRKEKRNGRDVYVIRTDAVFRPPLEFPAGPPPMIEAGQPTSFQFEGFGGRPPYAWRLESGSLPPGIRFADGALSGTATAAGVYPVRVALSDQSGRTQSRSLKLVVRTKNLAPAASAVLASVRATDAARRDTLWLTLPRSLYASSVDVIRDGKRGGPGSTFYSVAASRESADDHYGYEWPTAQEIGLLGYHAGSMEEAGGWFTSLRVEYRHESGAWRPVDGLLISPPLPGGSVSYNKPHFVEYLLAFRPVKTTAIRIIGPAAGSDRRDPVPFTSITELSVHGPLPRYEHLTR